MSGKPFGYPDATYLNRVTGELAVRNIDPETVKMTDVNLQGGRITVNGNNVTES